MGGSAQRGPRIVSGLRRDLTMTFMEKIVIRVDFCTPSRLWLRLLVNINGNERYKNVFVTFRKAVWIAGRLARFVPNVMRFVPKIRFVPNASASRSYSLILV